MEKKTSDSRDKIREQFDTGPYPRYPIEQSPNDEIIFIYLHNILNAYYLREKKVIQPEGKIILDAGCGSGYNTLALAQANPGAKIVGVDFSEESVKLAKKRLHYHGFENVEFYPFSLEELPKLGREFDYINCDEVLYLLPNPVLGLQAMKAVLKPQGIIRANLHSLLQRTNFYRTQKLFKMMGLMDNNPRQLEIDVVRETMNALKDQVLLKATTWDALREEDEEWFLMNYLLQSDKGYTIPEMFSFLNSAGLEFISMVNWRQWELMDLFKDPENLPVFLGLSLPEMSPEERLNIYELLHPIHRLLDFWCGHPNQAQPFVPVAEWTNADWQNAKVHLHPQMKTPAMKAELMRCVQQLQPFQISNYLPMNKQSTLVDSTIAAGLLLTLLESAQLMPSLVTRWQQLHMLNPVTLELVTQQQAFEVVRQALTWLEADGYVLLERQS